MPGKRQGIRRLITVAAAGVLAAPAFAIGSASAAPLAACTWTKTVYELPAAGQQGEVGHYDGQRYAVGSYGEEFWGNYSKIGAALWDNGRLVRTIPIYNTSFADVNASGTIAGYEYANGHFRGVTFTSAGTSTPLPADPSWTSYSAALINNRGDVVGSAHTGSRDAVVMWPASAPGTYRELQSPGHSVWLGDLDEQGRVIGFDSYDPGGGRVWDTDGKMYNLAAPTGQNSRYTTPAAIRDGRIVGSVGANEASIGAEWNAQGVLTRTASNAHSLDYLGGLGAVGGENLQYRSTLWRDGAVVDTLSAVAYNDVLIALSNDERTVVGTSSYQEPLSYHCS